MKIDWQLFAEILGERDSLFIHDMDKIEHMIDQLTTSFPENTIHTFAVKSNPILEILKFFVKKGLGLECASQEEVWLAIEAGCPKSMILHDGPAKTVMDLEYCLTNGIGIIANDEIDLIRIKEIITTNENLKSNQTESKIGIRVNPLIGYGNIEETSVSTPDSKFGIALESGVKIESIFSDFSFLNGIHVHIGSQGIPIEKLSLGINRVLKCISNLPEQSRCKVNWVDIGGGISVDYSNSELAFSFSDVFNSLEWFHIEHPEIQIITEYGRSLISTSAIFLSKAEKVFRRDGVQNIIIHGGADAFVRWVYRPENWHHRVTVEGESSGRKIPTQIHGPLCFSGDKLGGLEMIGQIQEGSLVAIHDAGAYVISMWSSHCNRRRPEVIGISKKRPPFSLFEGERREDIISRW